MLSDVQLIFGDNTGDIAYYRPTDKSERNRFFSVLNRFFFILLLDKRVLSDVQRIVGDTLYIPTERLFSVLNRFLAHLSHLLGVSYCDHWMSVVRRVLSVVNNCFKRHLLLNYWLTLTKLGRNDPYMTLF